MALDRQAILSRLSHRVTKWEPVEKEVQEPPIKFTELESIIHCINNDKDKLIVVAMGVDWSPPCKSTLVNLFKLTEGDKDPSMRRVKVFLLDEERERTFCKDNNIIVGTPVCQLFYRVQPLTIIRPGWEPIQSFVGPLSQHNARQLVQAALACIVQGNPAVEINF